MSRVGREHHGTTPPLRRNQATTELHQSVLSSVFSIFCGVLKLKAPNSRGMVLFFYKLHFATGFRKCPRTSRANKREYGFLFAAVQQLVVIFCGNLPVRWWLLS